MVSELEGVPAITTRREEALTGLQGLVSKGLGWARKYSLFQYPFVTACCGMEYMTWPRRGTTSTASARRCRASRRARRTCSWWWGR